MVMAPKVGKIYSYPNNPRVYKAQVAAAYLDLDIEVVPGFQMGVTNKSAEFLAKFPLGKVPAFESDNGELLTESDAIAYFVANYVNSSTPLVGATNYEKALVQQQLSFAASELGSNLSAWIYPLLGYRSYNKETEKTAKEQLQRALGALNTELLSKTFLVGERVTLADIVVACTLLPGYQQLFDEAFRAEFPNVNRWFLTMVNQPKFKSVVGEVKLCEKTLTYDPKKAAQQDKPKKEEKAKKEEKPKQANLEDIAAAEAKEEAKKKNPLDELPPSSFILDEWKRFYSNNEVPQSIEYFWKNYDPAGFSLWKVDYKYNDELGAIFMSSNLIGGFFQRLERARKYAFGSMVVAGSAKKSSISGFFVFRGQDVPAEVKDAADYDSYSFSKVDSSDAKVRAQFNDYLAWEGSNLPDTFADGKIFK